MKNLVKLELMLNAALASAVSFDVGEATKIVNSAFHGLEPFDTLKHLTEMGVLESARMSANDMFRKANPYYIKVGGKEIPLTAMYAKCPICGKETQVQLNSAIESGLIVSDEAFCDSCKEGR